jgi:hypothetical protein
MPQVGFESTIPVLELAKTVHDLDRETTMMLPLKNNLTPLYGRDARITCTEHLQIQTYIAGHMK